MAVACCFAPALALANPVGPKVVHGQVGFNTQGKLLTVTNSPGSIINWQGFSIAAGETARFVQQSAASAVLNRVVGADPSAILGALQSNGKVFLINPNGILFGAGARIDTAGLVASTLNMMDADFLSGRLLFGNTPGAGPLSNAGEIRTPAGGRVLLISPAGVENSGIIHSPKGEVILAAGKSVELADSANPEVRVEIAAPEARAVNLGEIVAESGKIGIYGGIVGNHGVVRADSAVVGENGRIVFRASHDVTLAAGSVTSAGGTSGGTVEISSGSGATMIAGSVAATGSEGSGGEVRILGERVGLVGSASLDASGERGGGTVLVGGDLQGANPNVRNAQMTYAGADTSIKADAGSTGNGGKVIVWADDSTRSHGSISARGGSRSGDGGFVETSGKRALAVTRGPDLRAPAGRNGTWLIDPNDIEIVAGSELDGTLNTGAPFFAPLGHSSRIGVELINDQLNIGSDVLITTASSGDTEGSQAGNITVNAPILKFARTDDDRIIGTTNLTLLAHNNIIINAGGSITSTGDPLNVSLIANSDGMGGGGVTIDGGITTNGGALSVQGTDLLAVNAAINTLNAMGTFGGSISFNSTGTGGVTIGAPITGGFFSASSGGTVTIASSVTSKSSVSLSGTQGVTVTAGITATGATLTSDNMDIQGRVDVGGGSVSVRQSTTGRAINVGTEVAGALSLTELELDNLLTTGSFTLGNSATGTITVNGPLSGVSPAFFSVSSGTSYTQNAGVGLTGQLSINAPAITINLPLSTSSTAGIALSADTLATNSAVTSAGNIDVSPRSFGRQINLGVAAPTGSALELTAAQVGNLVTPGRLRFSTGGSINIAGPISVTANPNTTLSLSSSNSITQSTGAAVTVPNLALSARNIDFSADNDVNVLAAQTICCSAGNIVFAAKPGELFGIGIVDGINGVTINNFSGTGTITLQADDLNIGASVRANIGDVNIMPRTVGRIVTLGADAAGTLGLTAVELAFVQGTKLTISGDRMDIAAPVNFLPATTVLAPQTTLRPIGIVAGAKSVPAALEFLDTELANLTGGTIVVGGPTAGPISVGTATSIPGTIGTFILHSGGAGVSSIDVAANLDAVNSLALTADTMIVTGTVNSGSGNLTLATSDPTRALTLGTDPGSTLGFDLGEISRLSAPAGTISFVGGADIDVNDAVVFAVGTAAGITLDAGATLNVNPTRSLSSPGAVTLRAPTLVINGTVNAAAGDATLIGNSMTIASAVNAPAGDVNVKSRDFRSIDLGGAGDGGTLGLDNTELNFLNPSGILRIGELDGFTNRILITAPITLAGGRTLSLKTGSGDIFQSASAPITITGGKLAAEASSSILLTDPNNVVDTVALSSWESSVAFTRRTSSTFPTTLDPLTIGDVDDLSGVSASPFGFGSGVVTLTADRLIIGSQIRGSTVNLLPTAAALFPIGIDIGTKSAGLFGLSQAELDLISATSVVVGNSSSGNIVVSQPTTMSSFTNLSLTTGNTLTTDAVLTSPAGSISLVADSMVLNAGVTAAETISVKPLSVTAIDLGGAGSAGVSLGIDALEFASLSGRVLSFGDVATINVTAPVAAAPAVTSVELHTDNLAITPGSSLTAPSVAISTMTASRTIDLGTATPGTLGLDAATLGRIVAANGSSFATGSTGTINVSAAGLPLGSDLALSAGTININESLAAGDELSLRANDLNIAAGKTATSAGGGLVSVAPHSGFMTLGASGSGLVVDNATLGRLGTSGRLQLGDSNTTGISIAQPIDASTFGALALMATGNISQTAGSTLSATNLSIQSTTGSVTLNENNDIDTLAANVGFFDTFSLTTVGTLTVGTVAGLSGVTANSGNVTLRSDALNINDSISANTVTLAPRTAGAAIDLGTKTGFGLTDAEIDRVSSGALTIGVSAAPNATGAITVSAPVDRAFGALNLATAPGSTINVNAALGSSTTSSVTMNAGAGGTANIAAPVTASGNISVTADAITNTQPISSTSGSISLTNPGLTGLVSIQAALNAISGINVSGKSIVVNAPITSSASFSSISLGAASGTVGSSVTINQAVTAGSSIGVTTDSIAINAPLTTTGFGSSVALQTRSSGMPVSLGLETPGAFSISTSELALLQVDSISIGRSGSTGSGDLTVNAPISGDFTSLTLSSAGDVTQTAGSTITVRQVDPDDSRVVRGALTVTARRIDLREANDIGESINGMATGPEQDFRFSNISPLKLQNVDGVTADGGRGKVVITTPTVAVSQPGNVGAIEQVLGASVAATLKAQDTQDDADKNAKDRKRDDDANDREEEKKKGTQSCS